MRSWISSLQARLILVFTIVLLITLGGVGLYTGLAAHREAQAFQERIDDARAERLQRLVTRFYRGNATGRENIQPTLEEVGSLFDRRIVLTDPQGNVIGDSDRRFSGPQRRGRGRNRQLPIGGPNQGLGSLTVAPGQGPQEIAEPPASNLASTINTSLVWTGIIAAIAGIVMLSFVSRWIVAPVRNLNTVAHRVGQGDLSQRANVSGPNEINELALTFNNMAENLQSAEVQRRNMAADIAHELRTPLSNIRGYVEAIKDGIATSDDTIDIIHQQTLHLSDLIEDLRLLAMAEAGNLRLSIAEHDLNEVLHASVMAIQPRAEAKGVDASYQPGQHTLSVSIDRTRISQVVGNLLENALVHTPQGGSISVHSSSKDGIVTVVIEDTGAGISENDMLNVFDRFYRADQSRNRATGGAGLGLTIARKLVEVHGGSIRVESTVGVGSRFIFEMPMKADSSSNIVEQ